MFSYTTLSIVSFLSIIVRSFSPCIPKYTLFGSLRTPTVITLCETDNEPFGDALITISMLAFDCFEGVIDIFSKTS